MRKAEPQVEILTATQGLVEEADLEERLAPHHHGRQQNVASLLEQADERDGTLRRRHLHEPPACERRLAADDGVAVDEVTVLIGLEEGQLSAEEIHGPQVVRVEKGHVPAARLTNPRVSSGPGAAILLR